MVVSELIQLLWRVKELLRIFHPPINRGQLWFLDTVTTQGCLEMVPITKSSSCDFLFCQQTKDSRDLVHVQTIEILNGLGVWTHKKISRAWNRTHLEWSEEVAIIQSELTIDDVMRFTTHAVVFSEILWGIVDLKSPANSSFASCWALVAVLQVDNLVNWTHHWLLNFDHALERLHFFAVLLLHPVTLSLGAFH